MNVAFRVDASTQLGAGHVMRCLALAEELRAGNHIVRFLTRDTAGNLNEMIQKTWGFKRHSLPLKFDYPELRVGTAEEQKGDVEATKALLPVGDVDWLVVDHYSLDARWERSVRSRVGFVLAIDDLANRPHDCDLLVDQNFSNRPNRYRDLAGPEVIRLLGPKYALVRREFSERRNVAQIPRSFQSGRPYRFHISFGGVDPNNATATALAALKQWREETGCVPEMDVVVGRSNPHRRNLKVCLQEFSSAELSIQVSDMAVRMAAADFAIGAGGSTLWERFCMGLPTAIVTTAENQVSASRALASAGLAVYVGPDDEVTPRRLARVVSAELQRPSHLREVSQRVADLVDGHGARRIARKMLDCLRSECRSRVRGRGV